MEYITNIDTKMLAMEFQTILIENEIENILFTERLSKNEIDKILLLNDLVDKSFINEVDKHTLS